MIPTRRLCKVIETSLEENNLDKFKEYLSSNDSSEALNATCLTTLVNILKKNGAHEDKIMHADCVLSCLDHFIKVNASPQKWEILANDVGKVCQLLFAISARYIKDETLIQKNTSIFTNLVYHGEVVADSVLSFTMDPLLKVASADDFSNAAKICILSTLSLMITQASRDLCREIIPSNVSSLNSLSNYLIVCGHYEIQVAIVEVLARCWFYLKDGDFKENFFTDFPYVLEKFKTYSFTNLDVECRLFLNDVNNGMGDKQSVFSIPCLVLLIDHIRYKKPSDVLYREFWIDFNIKSRSLSFYYQNKPDEFWGLMIITEDTVISAESKDSVCKGKDGNIVPAVKLEIAFKKDSNDPKLLKVYFRKSKEYEILEKRVVNKIFGDKFKNALTYDEMSVAQTPQMKRGSLEHHPKLSENKEQEDTSYTLNSTVISQHLNQTTNKKSDISPLAEKLDKEESSGDSDSFTHYITVLKNQEKNTATKMQTEEENIDLGIQPIIKGKKDSMLCGEQMEVCNKPETSDNNVNSANKNISTKKLSTPPMNIHETSKENLDETNKMKKHKSLIDIPTNSNSVKRRRLFSSEAYSINDLVLSSLEESLVEIPKYKLQKKEKPTFEPQINIDRKHISFSYIREKENVKTPQSMQSRLFDEDDEEENLINDEEDVINTKHQKEQKEDKASSFNYSEKKLLALNNTPEGVDESNIFSSKSPNFCLSKKETHLKKTYIRPKPQKNNRRKKTDLLSDSDPDYKPDYKPKSKFLPKVKPRQKRNKATEIPTFNTEELMRRFPILVDPMRDIEHVDEEIKVDSTNLKESDRRREIEVPCAVQLYSCDKTQKTPGSAVPYETRVKPIATYSMIPTPKVYRKKDVKTRKPTAKKTTVCRKKSTGKILKAVSSPTNVTKESTKTKEDFFGKYADPDESTTFIPQSLDLSCGNLLKFREHSQEITGMLKKVITLAEKEREIYYSSFSNKVHEFSTKLQELKREHVVITNNVTEAKSLLDANITIQKKIVNEMEQISKQFEESRLSLVENLSKIEHSQSSLVKKNAKDLMTYLYKNNTSTSILPSKK